MFQPTIGLNLRGLLAAAVTLSFFVAAASAQDTPQKKVLFLTKSSGFIHPVVARSKDAPDKLAYAEQQLVDFGLKHGYEVTCTKDASLLNPENLAKYDVLAMYTSGDLTQAGSDAQTPMTPAQKAAFLQYIADGKIGLLGIHAANDTFRETRPIDPFIKTLGAEFAGHASQQKSFMRVAFKFPGLENLKDFEMFEEWYTHTNVNPDMTVILVQDTASMTNDGKPEKMYQRPSFPGTWARMQGQGRVFYTSMGHREDVWTNDNFQQVLLAGLNWVSGRTSVELKPNLTQATPGYNQTTLDPAK
jgi:hypothetical protein